MMLATAGILAVLEQVTAGSARRLRVARAADPAYKHSVPGNPVTGNPVAAATDDKWRRTLAEIGGLYEMFGSDTEMEAGKGIELKFGDQSFIVRRAGGKNKKFQIELRKLTRPVRKLIEMDAMQPDQYIELLYKAYARAVVIDWVNVTDRAGNVLAFNEENFVNLMRELPDLFEAIQEQCMRISNFREEQLKEDGDTLGKS